MLYAIRRIILVSLIALLGCALSACGKKGPLYQPDQPRKGAKQTPAGSTPPPSQPTQQTP